jgi:small subunit ribosomal protein S19
MPKKFIFRGYSLEKLKSLSLQEFGKLLRARERRKLKRGLTEEEKKLLKAMEKEPKKFHRTHVKEMIILPQMIGAKVGVYIGGAKKGAKESEKWTTITITPEMIGRRLGEVAYTTKKVKHSTPGIGATRGTKFYASKG